MAKERRRGGNREIWVKKESIRSGNANRRGRVSTVDLLIRVARFVTD